MGFLKKLGGFFGKVWNGVKTAIPKVVGFVRDKVLPIASTLIPGVGLASKLLGGTAGKILGSVAQGAGNVVNNTSQFIDRTGIGGARNDV